MTMFQADRTPGPHDSYTSLQNTAQPKKFQSPFIAVVVNDPCSSSLLKSLQWFTRRIKGLLPFCGQKNRIFRPRASPHCARPVRRWLSGGVSPIRPAVTGSHGSTLKMEFGMGRLPQKLYSSVYQIIHTRRLAPCHASVNRAL